MSVENFAKKLCQLRPELCITAGSLIGPHRHSEAKAAPKEEAKAASTQELRAICTAKPDFVGCARFADTLNGTEK